MTKIEWTRPPGRDGVQMKGETWNPVVGCSPVSEGCRNCYAAREAIRLQGNPNPKISGPYAGTSEMRGAGDSRRPVFTGTVRTLPDRLEEPFSWREPRGVFVNSMSDLFHEDVPSGFIANVFAVMSACPQHTFMILTKRPERARELLANRSFWATVWGFGMEQWWSAQDLARIDELGPEHPLSNVWIGTSVEDQAAADARVPHLIQTPAVIRFLSCEPLLDGLDLRPWLRLCRGELVTDQARTYSAAQHEASNEARAFARPDAWALHWVITGGESGPGARPCRVDRIRSIAKQCDEYGVPVFVKQLGARPMDRNDRFDAEDSDDPTRWPQPARLEHSYQPTHQGELARIVIPNRKGGEPMEWPADLRQRQFPKDPRTWG